MRRYLDYLGRAGELELETDDGERLQGKGTEKALLEDWDLDLDSDRRQADLSAANGRQAAEAGSQVDALHATGHAPRQAAGCGS